MKLFSYNISEVRELDSCLEQFTAACPQASSCILAVLITSSDQPDEIFDMTRRIREAVPQAKICGTTTSGEIGNARLYQHTHEVCFYVFESSTVELKFYNGHEMDLIEAAEDIVQQSKGQKPVALGMFVTLKTLNGATEFLERLGAIPAEVPVFGGSTDSYTDKNVYFNETPTYVFLDDVSTNQGVIAFFFYGEELHVHVDSYLGWRPLGNPVVVTEVESHTHVKTMNHKPVTSLYKKYLGVEQDENFYAAVLPFPLMVNRRGHDIARIPTGFKADGSMTFSSGIRQGEEIHLSYGDPGDMQVQAHAAQEKLRSFAPEGILLLPCLVRNYYLREDFQRELAPFGDIAPTVGYLSYGEVQRFDDSEELHLLNGAMLIIGFREGGRKQGTIRLSSMAPKDIDFSDDRIALARGMAHFATVANEEMRRQHELMLQETKQKQALEEKLAELSGLHTTLQDKQARLEEREKKLETAEGTRNEQLDIIHSVSKLFDCLYYVDLRDGTYIQLNVRVDEVEEVIAERGDAKASFEMMYKHLVDEEYVEEVKAFTDLTTLDARLLGRPWISCQFHGPVGGWAEGIFIAADRNAEGRCEHVIWGTRNIDEQKMKEITYQEELEEAKAAAEAASKAKSTFLFNMSHDIRTPLNAIKGFNELADREPDNMEKLAFYRQKVAVASDQLIDILNNVLEMARIENNKVVIDEELTEVKSFFDSWTMVFEGELKAKRQSFSASCETEHSHVYLDKIHLTEVMMNIMSNAIKYTPEGGQISASLKELAGSAEGMCMVETRIKDTGVGMPADFIEHIFDEFSRERNSSTSGIQGTGLGMAIVQRLVRLMHGTVEIQSRIGEGTEIILRIPHKIGSASALVTEQAEEEAKGYDFSGSRVLLAEDIEVNAMIATEVLKMFGFEVDWADNGVKCVDMLSRAEAGYYDVILMDIQMPEMDGYQATRQIRSMEDEERSGIPIVALSANAFKEDMEKSLLHGMNAHVAKPLDVQQLKETLTEVLSERGRACIGELLALNGYDVNEINNSRAGVYCTDRSRRILFWSRGAEKLTGYGAAVMVGRYCFNSGLRHKSEEGAKLCIGKCPMEVSVLDGKTVSEHVSTCLCDGGRKWVDVKTAPLYKNGKIMGAIEFFTLSK